MYSKTWVRSKVKVLVQSLQGTGVVIKINSALRACGYDLINEIHDSGLRVFADLKLYDIDETLKIDGMLLRETHPELLTVGPCGPKAMRALKKELPDTEVLGITALTSLTEEDTQAMFVCSIADTVTKLASLAVDDAHLDGLISGAKHAPALRKKYGTLVTLNTPAIRPLWTLVPGDDQNPAQIMTPAKAIAAGADRIVVGRPITRHEDPRNAVMLILNEIEETLASMG
jgi:orotidine-5'-phosphate decarboxylase